MAGMKMYLGLAVCCWAVALQPMLERLWRIRSELAPPSEKEPDALRVGMLGASLIGKVAVVLAASKQRGVVVTAVAARDLGRAEAYAQANGIPAALGGPAAYAELLKRTDVDAVYIGLPTKLHFQWAEAALAAGKHVLLEKPAAANALAAMALLAAAARSGKVLMEAAHYRYHPAALRVQELMGTELGTLQNVTAEFHMVDPKAWFSTAFGSRRFPGREERLQERVKNLDRWWYCVDSLLYMTGARDARVVNATEGRYSVSAQLQLAVPGEGAEPRWVDATIRMSRDKLLPPGPFDWSFRGHWKRGSVRLSNMGFPFVYHFIHKVENGATRMEQLYGEGETTFEHQLAFFAEAARSGRPAPELTESSLATMKVVDAVLQAAGSGPLPSEVSA